MAKRYRLPEKGEKQKRKPARLQKRKKEAGKKDPSARRAFWVAFVCTLCLCMTILGILEADYQSRQTGFGDGKTLLYEITGQEGDLLDQLGMLDFFHLLCYTYK